MLKKKINCFFIGVQKAGTSSIHKILANHPNIHSPIYLKDKHFKITENERYVYQMHKELTQNYSSEKVILHTGVNYITDERYLKSIYEYNEEASILLILRNPIERAISAYRYFCKIGSENKELREIIREYEYSNKKNVKKIKPNSSYIEHGMYSWQITNLLKYFNRNKIYVGLYEKIFINENVKVDSIFNFLNLEDYEYDNIKTNVTGKIRSEILNRVIKSDNYFKNILRKLSRKNEAVKKYKKLIHKKLIDINTIYGSEINYEYEVDLLKDIYRDDVFKTSDLIGVDLNQIWDIN